jgi:hypothetical protein
VKRSVSLQFLNPKRVGRTPWTGISPSEGRYLHKHRINADRHPCLEWEFEPTIPVFERAKAVAYRYINEIKIQRIQVCVMSSCIKKPENLYICLSVYLSIYLAVCLSIYLSIYLSVCLSMALQPFVGPWPIFQFLDLSHSR